MEFILYATSMPLWRGQGKHYVYILQYMFLDFNNFFVMQLRFYTYVTVILIGRW